MDRGFVLADERLRTNVPERLRRRRHRPGLQLAHLGFGRASSSPRRSPGSNPPPIDEAGIPRVTYSDPEVASVGLTEAQAKEKYGEDRDASPTTSAGNGKSQILKTAGFVKLVRVEDGPVVGVHMVGSRVGELVAEAQLIYNWEAYPDEVASSSTPTRPRPRRSARRTWPSPASRCTRTADPAPTPTHASATKEPCPDAGIGHHARAGRERHRGHRHPLAQAGG